MKAYRIEYKKVIVAYRSWWRPVYDFRFCVIEIDEKIVCLLHLVNIVFMCGF